MERVRVIGGAVWFLAALTIGLSVTFPVAWIPISLLGALSALLAFLWKSHVQTLEMRLAATERGVAEMRSQLAGQRATMDQFADGLGVGIIVCDSRARIDYINKSAREMFGFERPDGRSILAVTLSPELDQLAGDVAKGGGANEIEITFRLPSERICVCKAWPSEDGRVFVSLIELTELRRMERVRRDFVANVSHELRTPMTVIRSFAETILDDDSPDLRQRYLTRIIDEVDRLTAVSHDLLVLSAAESGPVRRTTTDIAELVKYATELLQRSADDKRLKLTYTGPDSLIIEANGAQLSQVFVNVVENAIKYTQAGEVSASLEQIGDQAVVTVKDTGVGISAEHQPRLFERFYRVDKGRGRESGGTGLGLSIVKHFVEAHGGTIHVDSVLNEGSTFVISLPIGSPSVDATASEDPGSEVGSRSSSDSTERLQGA